MKKLTEPIFIKFRILSVITLLLISSFYGNSQSLPNKNNIQLEIFGSGGFYSLSYERFIFNKEKRKTSFQIGLSYFSSRNFKTNDLSFNPTINQLFSKENNHLELSAGCLINYTNSKNVEQFLNSPGYNISETSILPFIRTGYRFQKEDSRILYRVGFTPFFEFINKRLNIIPWAGLGIGYSL